MSAPAFSERFLHHQAGTVPFRYTVPAGKRLIITCVTVCNTLVGAAVYYVKVGPIFCVYDTSLASGKSATANVRVVAYQGEVIESLVSADGIHLTVSGYLLEDATSHTGPPGAAAAVSGPPAST